MVADDRLHLKQQKLVQGVGKMSILMGISVLLALLLVKTRASGTRNGLFEANIDTACITLSALPAYLPYRKKFCAGIKQKTPTSCDVRVSYKKVAATYSPTWWGSTIGDGELNFSVRNGKRWILTAITATICI